MAGDLIRVAQLQAYIEQAGLEPDLFLSSFFNIETTVDTQEVEVDIQRGGRKVAVDILPGAGGRMNEAGIFTNKRYTPPMYDEFVPIDAFSAFNRLPGETSTAPVTDNAGRIVARLVEAQIEMRRKIQRAMERQASQALFAGAITLHHPLGDSITIDFAQKGTHDVTPTAWSDISVDAIGNISDMCRIIQQDGKTVPTMLIFGEDAMAEFQLNTAFIARLDSLHRKQGELIMPQMRDQGAVYHGNYSFEDFVLEMWTYPSYYEDPDNSDTLTEYVPKAKVLVIDPKARMDKVFGAVPIMKEIEDAKMRAFGIDRLPLLSVGDLVPYTTVDDNNMVVRAGVRSRPLLIPTAIDTYGIINT